MSTRKACIVYVLVPSDWERDHILFRGNEVHFFVDCRRFFFKVTFSFQKNIKQDKVVYDIVKHKYIDLKNFWAMFSYVIRHL